MSYNPISVDNYIKYQLDSEIVELEMNLASSLAISVELHFKYRHDGFTPSEFYSYITGNHSTNQIQNWSDAVMQLALFLEQKQSSYEIH